MVRKHGDILFHVKNLFPFPTIYHVLYNAILSKLQTEPLLYHECHIFFFQLKHGNTINLTSNYHTYPKTFEQTAIRLIKSTRRAGLRVGAARTGLQLPLGVTFCCT